MCIRRTMFTPVFRWSPVVITNTIDPHPVPNSSKLARCIIVGCCFWRISTSVKAWMGPFGPLATELTPEPLDWFANNSLRAVSSSNIPTNVQSTGSPFRYTLHKVIVSKQQLHCVYERCFSNHKGFASSIRACLRIAYVTYL